MLVSLSVMMAQHAQRARDCFESEAMMSEGDDSNSWVYSRKLFRNEENGPMEFYVCPSEHADLLTKLIKTGGGEVVSSDNPRAIHIASQNGVPKNGKTVSASYIYASCLENKLLDINYFQLAPLSASVVFQSLLEGIEKMIDIVPKEQIEKIVHHVSKNDKLWETIAENEEFKDFSVLQIRNTYNMWAFLSLKVGKSKSEIILRSLKSIVKSIAEEYCVSDIKTDASEKCTPLAKKRRISEESFGRNAAEIKNRCGQEKEKLERVVSCPDTVHVRLSAVAATEDHKEAVVSKEGKKNTVLETCDKDVGVNGVESTCDEVCGMNGVESTCDKVCGMNVVELEACTSGSSMAVEEHVSEKVVAESCVDERTGEKNVSDSKSSDANITDEIASLEDDSVNVKKQNRKVKEKQMIVTSGVWLDPKSMKELLSKGKEVESEEEDDAVSEGSSSGNSSSSVGVLKELFRKGKESEDEDETMYEESSSGDSDSVAAVMKKHQPNKLYTFKEDLVIIKWVLKSRRCQWKVQGNRLWEYFEKRKILPNRSWQSMKERFKRRISSNLNKYNLPAADIVRLKSLL